MLRESSRGMHGLFFENLESFFLDACDMIVGFKSVCVCTFLVEDISRNDLCALN